MAEKKDAHLARQAESVQQIAVLAGIWRVRV
jgi:hypothetical protein